MNESAEQWNKSGRKAIRERNYRQRSSLLKATPHQSAQRASIRRHPHICASCDNDPLDEPGPGGGVEASLSLCLVQVSVRSVPS
jgi:hypothetical protein